MAAACAADLFSANTALLLSGLNEPTALGAKRTAEEAELPDRPEPAGPQPEAPGNSSEARADMEVSVTEGKKDSNLIALVRVDGSHVAGNQPLEKHIIEFGGQLALTRRCLGSSTNMEDLGPDGFQIMNGTCGSSTCIMATLECPVTAMALILRYSKSGFKVKKEGVTVDYKALNGKEWYKMADKKADASSKNTNDTICVILRGLVCSEQHIEYYVKLLTDHFGPLNRTVTVNGHKSGGVTTENLDGSVTIVMPLWTTSSSPSSPLSCRA